MTAQSSRVPALAMRLPVRRQRLMLSCAAAALATVALPAGRAHAQAFQGSETVVSGIATRTPTSNTSETITVGSATATINWSPFDIRGTGTIDFLPAGNTATFTNNPQTTTDFTVLNRIIPTDLTRPVAFNGSVISQLQDLSQNVTPGGSVWFYSPGGIVVGSTAVFDVGSLLLTTNDVTSFSTDANGFTGRFLATPGSTAAVTIAPGAQINATATNSYVALVAPRVVQDGAVRVDGSAAYVAAEDVTMTMNQGLFDIQVAVGTGDLNGIAHAGSTGGPSSSGAGDYHRVYMVAVPKNQALTMLLGGGIGFDAATSATIDNGQIVLSAGWNIQDTPNSVDGSSPGTPNASMNLGAGTYSSDVYALARGEIMAIADTGSIGFGGDVNFNAYLSSGNTNAWLGAINGNSLTVAGDVVLQTTAATAGGLSRIYANSLGTLSIAGNAYVTASGPAGQGGGTSIAANIGTVTIGGLAHLDSSVSGLGTASAGNSIDAVGGGARVSANNGTISAGSMIVSANATGQSNAGTGDTVGGDGTGGTAEVWAVQGGQITTGSLTVSANGTGGSMGAGATRGGTGRGGRVEILNLASTITVAGNLIGLAEGVGGAGTGAAGQLSGGDGFGGSLAFTAGGPTSASGATMSTLGVGGANAAGDGGLGLGGSTTLTVGGGDLALGSGGLLASSSGIGGDGGNLGGTGDGGSIWLLVDGGSVTTTGEMLIWSNGLGGAGATGGDGNGGWTDVEIGSGGGTLSAVGDASFEAFGTGGNGTANAGGSGGAGGDGSGGSVFLIVDSLPDAGAVPSLDFGTVFVNANGNGGLGGNGLTGGTGGAAFGGDAQFYLGAGSADFALLQVFASTRGGGGGAGSAGAGGAGGLSEAGFASIDVFGTMTATRFSSYARAFGGAGGAGSAGAGTGGDAYGGTAFADVLAGGSAVATDLIDIVVTASAGAGSTGGLAAGGDGQLWVEGTLGAGRIVIDSTALGGGGGGGDGGAASGGTSAIELAAGDLTVTGTTDILASAVGGAGTVNGGLASGGAADLETFTGGTAGLATLRLTANGSGGTAGTGGTAGAGTGGVAFIDLFGASVTADTITLTANGDVAGGFGFIDLIGATLTANSLAMTADGGQAGGSNYVILEPGDLGEPALLDVNAFAVQSNGGAQGGFIYFQTLAGTSASLGSATLTASGGSNGAGGLFFDYAGAIGAQSLTAATDGSVSLISHGGADLAVAGAIDIAADGAISTSGDPGGTIAANRIDLAGGALFSTLALDAQVLALDSASNLAVGDLSAGQSLTLTALGDLDAGNLSAGNTVALDAGGSLSVGNVTAGTSATFSAGAVASFFGTVSAPAITVTSADIDITGQLGVFGVTDTLVLNAVSDGEPIIIGGVDPATLAQAVPGQGPLAQDGLQYRLSAGEDIEAASIVVNAIGANGGPAPNVQLLDLQIDGSQTAGGGASNVALNTGGSVLVDGAVLYGNSGPGDTLAINAGGTVQINTSNGGAIAMTGPAGLPAGTLLLTADDIWAGDQALLDALNADPNFAGRDDALATNPGADNQAGHLLAGGIDITFANTLFVQNSGTAAAPAGITVGGGGLTLRAAGPDALIVGSGLGINPDGTPVTGEDFVALVVFDTSQGAFSPNSRFNGCDSGGACDFNPPPGPPPAVSGPENILGPVEVIAPGDTETDSEAEGGISVTLAGALFDTGDVTLDQLIDEGITSGGDSSLWFGGDGDDDDDDDDDEDDKGGAVK